jgi:hypothetical protein
MDHRGNDWQGTPHDGTPNQEGTALPDGVPAPDRSVANDDPRPQPWRATRIDRDASINTDIYRNPNRELPA